MPTRDIERAVYATHARRVDEGFPGEASRRVAQLEGVIRKARKAREVLISLHRNYEAPPGFRHVGKILTTSLLPRFRHLPL